MKSSNTRECIELTATFIQCRKRFEGSSYMICTFKDSSGKYITVTGENLPEVDYPVTFSGYWVVHQTFGEQFRVDMVIDALPTSSNDIVSFIRNCSGVWKKQAQEMVRLAGTQNFWNVLYTDPKRFCSIEGITENTISNIVCKVKRMATQRDLYRLFGNELTMDSWQYRKICEIFHENLAGMVDSIRENPFLLIQAGFSFLDLDRFSCNHAIMPPQDHRRLYGAAQQVLMDAMGQCHTCLPGKVFLGKMMELLRVNSRVSEKDCRSFIVSARRRKELVLYRDLVYLPNAYSEESLIAKSVSSMSSCQKSSIDRAEFEEQMQIYAQKKGFALSPNQEDAVWTVLTQPFCVITGGPGTGKSTILDAILHCWSHFYKEGDWILMAPTGKAAVRMNETTDQPATTIHSTLQLNVEKGFDAAGDGPATKLESGLVIVDESSMIDQSVAAALISSLRYADTGRQHFVLVGDPDQLPSVGYGNVLADLISSGAVPVCSLSTIYRQAAGNPIITNSIRIRDGITELDWSDKRFRRYHVGDDAQNMNAAIQLYQTWVKAYGIDKVVMLAPYHKKKKQDGSTQFCSTEYLNTEIQKQVNPPCGRIAIKGIGVSFYEGDRVMQLRNTDVLSNGDIGTITAIHPSASKTDPCITVQFENGYIQSYLKDDLNQLSLAYAMSVHKSQGSQWPCVITVLPSETKEFLRKNILYTAITRSSTAVAIFSPTNTIRFMISNNTEDTRFTQLANRLQSA